MKEKLIDVLNKIKDDARFFIYHYKEDGTFTHEFVNKPFINDLIQNSNVISYHPKYEDRILIDNKTAISTSSFNDNIFYETNNVQDYFEYVNSHNPYHNVFIKLDKENKIISFKLGNKSKTLQIIEEGINGFVSKIYRQKYMKCNNINDLEEHIKDPFWNPRMVSIGRKALKLEKVLF